MKVLLATPNFHQPRGNTITVQRIADGLEKNGITTEIISTTEKPQKYSLPEADIVHGFHAYRFYTFMQQLDTKPKAYMITITGTDLNHNLYDEDTRQDVITCLREAKAIHVFNEEGKKTIEKEIPDVKDKLFMIPQGTSEFISTSFPHKKPDGSFLFVLPAGIRKIKDVPAAIKMLQLLREKDNQIRLWLVGPILEESEGNKVKRLVEENKEWVSYLGQVPHDQMGTIYEEADCILNTSISEGQSSAILEAMGYGLPVLVANNEGNASIIMNEETGFIYDSQNQFLDYAEKIMNNVTLRQAIGHQAMNYISSHHSGNDEIKSLLAIYETRLR
ncbi:MULTISPECIES: glycosyltransferase family 4 protein [Paraliobacillus]|uniref:glycosyltransferase family 4 protein n=1 Tax=Paraliobacillus TaxID=200903 RepID=UPI0018E57AD3|nr:MULTISPECIES: glycosyltransferase family 4 protein [Paraliobacillus]